MSPMNGGGGEGDAFGVLVVVGVLVLVVVLLLLIFKAEVVVQKLQSLIIDLRVAVVL